MGKSECSQQLHYEFGLRKLKSVCGKAGHEFRKGAFDREDQAMCAAVQCELFGGFDGQDLHIAERLLREHFALEALPFEPPPRSCKWSVAAHRTCNLFQKCSLVFPVPAEDSPAFAVALESEVAKSEQEFVKVPLTMGTSTNE